MSCEHSDIQLIEDDNTIVRDQIEASSDDTYKVIQAVKSHTVIWKTEVYGNCVAKLGAVEAQWNSIRKELDPSGEKKLTYYRRLWNRVRTTLEESFPSELLIEHRRKTWKHFKDMEFYYFELCAKRYNENYNTVSNEEPDELEESGESDSSEGSDESDEDMEEPNFANMKIGKEDAELVWRYILLKKINGNVEDQMLDIMNKICDTALNMIENSKDM